MSTALIRPRFEHSSIVACKSFRNEAASNDQARPAHKPSKFASPLAQPQPHAHRSDQTKTQNVLSIADTCMVRCELLACIWVRYLHWTMSQDTHFDSQTCNLTTQAQQATHHPLRLPFSPADFCKERMPTVLKRPNHTTMGKELILPGSLLTIAFSQCSTSLQTLAAHRRKAHDTCAQRVH